MSLRARLRSYLSDAAFSEILTGSAWALSARILGTGLTLVSSVIIARVYGAGMVGIVAVITSLLNLTTALSLFGTSTSILRIIPEQVVRFSYSSAYKSYCKIQFLVVGVSVVAGALLYLGAAPIASRLFTKPQLSSDFQLTAAFVAFQCLATLNTQASRGLKLVRTFAFMQFLPQMATLLLLSLGLAWHNTGVPVYATLGASCLTGIIGWLLVRKSFKEKMRPDELIHCARVGEIFRISLPMLMGSFMALGIEQAGVIVLGIYGSEAETGYFSIAARFATLTTFVLAAINSIAAPKFAELFHSGKTEELLHVARRTTKLIFWTTAPVLLALICLGQPIIRILYGRDFTVAYTAMLILVVGQFVNSASGSTGYFMNMTGNQVVYQNVMLGAILLNVILNVLLVPHYSILGAALAAAGAVVFFNVYFLMFIKRKYGKTIGYIPLPQMLWKTG